MLQHTNVLHMGDIRSHLNLQRVSQTVAAIMNLRYPTQEDTCREEAAKATGLHDITYARLGMAGHIIH